MPKLALIREEKIPADNRVALTPDQCKWIQEEMPHISIVVQPSPERCYSDREYQLAGITLQEDLHDCDMLLGIKEVPPEKLIPGKCYLFFSHTKKAQAHNRRLMQEMVRKKITLIDYECLTHEDGQRILGFGFFAGIVGAHNGIMAYGNRTGLFGLKRVREVRDYRQLIHTYFGLKLPNIKVAVTGSGRVAHGVLEIMNLLGLNEVEPFDYLHRRFEYPVYVHLKGRDLYERKDDGTYNREDFHNNPQAYKCSFSAFTRKTDVLMNGVYWDKGIAPLFTLDEFRRPDFSIQTIADITNDTAGSIPINIGDSTIADPVYGVDRQTLQRTEPYISGSIDIMAIGNLPNELPRDASRYFGEQIIKFILKDLTANSSPILERASILKAGTLTAPYRYLSDYSKL